MTTGPDLAIRRLTAADAPGCAEVVRSLPYHFGDPDGRRECAEAVRQHAGLVAVHQRTRAFYQAVGFLPARELPDLWPGDKALLLVMPLDAQVAAADGATLGA